MPNHVMNVLYLSGPEERRIELLECVKGDNDGEFIDFNTLIPEPPCLKDYNPDHGVIVAVEKFVEKPLSSFEPLAALQQTNRALAPDRFEDEEKQALLERGIKNFEECGYIHWYDWRTDHWNTKWNAYDTQSDNPGYLQFLTAWSPALPVVQALALKFPDVQIDYWYADEDASANCGHCLFKDGRVTGVPTENGSPEAWAIYFECRGEQDDFIKQPDGTYKYKDDED